MPIYKNVAARMTAAGLRRACDLLMCTAPQFRAVLEVEARGSGFDKQGRVLILFEPHVFFRCLPVGPLRERAVSEGLAWAKWKPGAYPADSYPRLLNAMAVDETAALKACSWGMGQILGENHRMAGYSTVQDMVDDFSRSEDAQVLGMARFIAKAGLAKHLRAAEWAAFARGYNGPGYAKNAYDKRLADAHLKWTRAKDQFAVPAARPGKTAVDQSNAAKAQSQATAGGAVAAGVGGAATATVQPTKPATAPENQSAAHSWSPVLGWAAAGIILAGCAFLLWRRAKALLPVGRWSEPNPLNAGAAG